MSGWNGFAFLAIDGEGDVTGVDKTAADLGILLNPGASDPILPATRDRTVTVPGRPGRYYFGADLGPRNIALPCTFIDADTQQELSALKSDLADYLLDASSEPKELVLAFEADITFATPNTGTAYRVFYSGQLELTRSITIAEFEIPFTCNNPVTDVIAAEWSDP